MLYTLEQLEQGLNFITSEEDKDQLLTKEQFYSLITDDTPTNPNFDDKQTINGVTINKGHRYRYLINKDLEITNENLTNNAL
jgi:hypothetical protein